MMIRYKTYLSIIVSPKAFNAKWILIFNLDIAVRNKASKLYLCLDSPAVKNASSLSSENF